MSCRFASCGAQPRCRLLGSATVEMYEKPEERCIQGHVKAGGLALSSGSAHQPDCICCFLALCCPCSFARAAVRCLPWTPHARHLDALLALKLGSQVAIGSAQQLGEHCWLLVKNYSASWQTFADSLINQPISFNQPAIQPVL
jgi:hypothetical protein